MHEAVKQAALRSRAGMIRFYRYLLNGDTSITPDRGGERHDNWPSRIFISCRWLRSRAHRLRLGAAMAGAARPDPRRLPGRNNPRHRYAFHQRAAVERIGQQFIVEN